MRHMVWIYDRDRKLRQVEFQLLSFPEYAPQKMARYTTRMGRLSYYVYYGDTAEDCCDSANEWAANRIVELEREIAKLKSEMIRP